MITYASGDRVPYTWPVRWAVPRPTFHAVDPDNHLRTVCGQVIGGPRWASTTRLESRAGDGVRVPVDYVACPCLDDVLERAWERRELVDIDPARYVE